MNTTDITVGTAVTGITGVCGLGLSVYNTCVLRNQNKPNIKVSVSVGFISDGSITSSNQLSLEAANIGQKPVVLSSYGFKLPGNKQVIFDGIEVNGKTFPCSLMPGESCTIAKDIASFAQSFQQKGYSGKIKIYGFFRDQLGIEYKMKKPYLFELNEWR